MPITRFNGMGKGKASNVRISCLNGIKQLISREIPLNVGMTAFLERQGHLPGPKNTRQVLRNLTGVLYFPEIRSSFYIFPSSASSFNSSLMSPIS